jgi:RHS repeat-associated protein
VSRGWLFPFRLALALLLALQVALPYRPALPAPAAQADSPAWLTLAAPPAAADPDLDLDLDLNLDLFTGQRWDSGTGLYWHNSRWYDPLIGRFIQADTIVPQPGNPQALNRYSYTLNNPVKYTDPTGHCVTPMGIPIPGCVEFVMRMAQQVEALIVQYGPQISRVIQVAQQWADKTPALVDMASGANNSAQQLSRQGGNTADPGGLGPNDPWRWGSNYRANYESYYGVARDPNYQVHHVLPQQWRDVLAKANVNVDDPRWLREVTRLRVHQEFYTNRWADFAKDLQGRTPTAQEIVRFARQLEQEYIQKFGSALYRQSQGLPGQIDWEALWAQLNALMQGGAP